MNDTILLYISVETAAPVAVQPVVTDEMVTRFLGWHLPQDFAPDAGISFNPSPDPHSWPVGTNLLTDPQARAMLEYVLQGAPAAVAKEPTESVVLFDALSGLVKALRERHYGRMPNEVQAAYDKAWAIVFSSPVAQEPNH